LKRGEQEYLDGAVVDKVLGTYVHGIFDNDGFRTHLLTWLWRQSGRAERPVPPGYSARGAQERAFNQLADLVRSNLDMNKVKEIMGLA
jgi:adenosylcobyric acid synthase